jgi:hypothetical protein
MRSRGIPVNLRTSPATIRPDNPQELLPVFCPDGYDRPVAIHVVILDLIDVA